MTRQTVQHEVPSNPKIVPVASSADATNVNSKKCVADAATENTSNTVKKSNTFDLTKATETQWKIYQSNNEWLRFADLKAGALLTANGALFAAVLSAIKNNTDILRTNPLVSSLTVLSGTALLVSVGYCLWCINPKTARFHAQHDHTTESLLFFEHVAAFSKEEYRKSAIGMDNEETIFEQISQQVWINARVAWAKHRQVTLAIRALAVSIGFALCAALVALFI